MNINENSKESDDLLSINVTTITISSRIGANWHTFSTRSSMTHLCTYIIINSISLKKTATLTRIQSFLTNIVFLSRQKL